MMGWNLMEMGYVCRERCGGGSYLSNSVIPECIASCHSAMTAEGDNRVLMQKVVKDIMADMQKKLHKMPQLTVCPKKQIPNMKSIATLEVLTNLIYYREQALVKSFAKLMQKKIMEEGKPFFDVWMYEVSDEIQAMAGAYGDRFMLEAALEAHAEMADNKKAQAVIEKNIYLYCVFNIKENLGWYTMEGCISLEAAREIGSVFEQAVKDLVPHMNTCVEALGVIAKKHLMAPIARDYVAFNA
jgi:acyl-CoA oxidase